MPVSTVGRAADQWLVSGCGGKCRWYRGGVAGWIFDDGAKGRRYSVLSRVRRPESRPEDRTCACSSTFSLSHAARPPTALRVCPFSVVSIITCPRDLPRSLDLGPRPQDFRSGNAAREILFAVVPNPLATSRCLLVSLALELFFPRCCQHRVGFPTHTQM